jgi:hypothetical protein
MSGTERWVMMTPYRHTQIGYVILVMLTPVIVILAAVLMLAPDGWPLLAILIPLVLGAVAFARLTVTVDANSVWLRFGLGLIRKRIPTRDILSCGVVNVPWYAGWGIRWTGDGWLYNVSGGRAVELRMRNGKRYLIGTDRPQELESAIRQATASAGVPLTEPVEPAPLAGWRRWSPAAIVVSIVALVLAMILVPQYMLGYQLSPEGITVHLATTRVFLPREEITSASVIHYRLRWRTFGTSAVRYHSGWFDVYPVGRARVAADRVAGEGVLLTLRNQERVLLTPPDPESFVRWHVEGLR